jgi:hypothetical protein
MLSKLWKDFSVLLKYNWTGWNVPTRYWVQLLLDGLFSRVRNYCTCSHVEYLVQCFSSRKNWRNLYNVILLNFGRRPCLHKEKQCNVQPFYLYSAVLRRHAFESLYLQDKLQGIGFQQSGDNPIKYNRFLFKDDYLFAFKSNHRSRRTVIDPRSTLSETAGIGEGCISMRIAKAHHATFIPELNS